MYITYTTSNHTTPTSWTNSSNLTSTTEPTSWNDDYDMFIFETTGVMTVDTSYTIYDPLPFTKLDWVEYENVEKVWEKHERLEEVKSGWYTSIKHHKIKRIRPSLRLRGVRIDGRGWL
jgi:hypothetical protein